MIPLAGCTDYGDGPVEYHGLGEKLVESCVHVATHTDSEYFLDGSETTNVRAVPKVAGEHSEEWEITGQTEFRLSDDSHYVDYWTCKTTTDHATGEMTVKLNVDHSEPVEGTF
ncbi:hypothetical protein [Herbiconiux solani]|uniref:hypothetical protein n=1 Tax=Herbiconiux solani TaxID=661329 RepID=UPI0012EE2770|nr:hypothetical protein [Herbiconiux solani]